MTLLRQGRVTGSVTLPEYFANLTPSGDSMLAWRWKAAWLVGETGRVVWSATMERRITSAFGEADGFCLLAGQLASFRRPVEELLAAETGNGGDPRRKGEAR